MTSNDPYEKEQARLLALWEELQSDDEADEAEIIESDDSEIDGCEQLQHHSETEQEDSDTNEPRHLLFIGKDKSTKWRKHQYPLNVRTRRQNIISHLPGPKGNAKNSTTPLQTFQNFIDQNIIDAIVENTNIYISSIKEQYQDPQDVTPTNATEIHALIGLLILIGTFKSSRRFLREFWETNGTGVEIFPAVMGYRRMKFLLQCLRFDNIFTRQNRKPTDKFAPIREVWELFVSNCKNSYCVGEYVTLDEMLFSFRGRCPFRVYIPNKPSKYGIKVFALIDARTFYTVNLEEVYLGEQPIGPFRVSNKVPDVVKRMIEPINGSGRNVSMDNWFTSFSVIEDLFTDYRLTVVGTVKKNKRELPTELTEIKSRPVYSSIFAYQQNMTLVSYVPRKKNVLAVSSMHYDGRIDQDTGDKKKPEMITFYNATKGGVDSADQKMPQYTVSRNTRRWPMVMFYNMINIAGINGHVVYKSNSQETNKLTKSRRIFLTNLALKLVNSQLQKRAVNQHISRDARKTACRLTQIPLQDSRTAPSANRKRGKCFYCRNRNTRYFCQRCQKCLCLEHAQPLCADCVCQVTED
nr:unnamed protein product [Callosobruchus chinensis]